MDYVKIVEDMRRSREGVQAPKPVAIKNPVQIQREGVRTIKGGGARNYGTVVEVPKIRKPGN